MAVEEKLVLRCSVQVDAIAKVPGIDVLFIGPFDLGNNIGHPILDGTMHDELKEAIVKIQEAAKENKKSTGIYCTSGDQARQFADEGFHMVFDPYAPFVTTRLIDLSRYLWRRT